MDLIFLIIYMFILALILIGILVFVFLCAGCALYYAFEKLGITKDGDDHECWNISKNYFIYNIFVNSYYVNLRDLGGI